MEKTIDRIEQLRRSKGMTVSELGERLGYSNSAFAKALKSRASVKDVVILKVLEVFPEVNLFWLLRGEYSPLEDTRMSIDHCTEFLSDNIE